jgi:betaine-aldehyde dehydrogenase
MAAAAETPTPVTLELGGKDPALVLEDADLERAARGVVYGAFFNAGQTCISIERAYVVRSVYDRFVARVVELAAGLRVGTGPNADVGPLVTDAQVGVVERQVREALMGGARALTGGRRAEEGSRLYLPTVLVDVGPSMAVVCEESFGPLLPIIVAEDEEDAVRRANASGYGLFASVWTGDRARGLSVARRLRAGGVSVNDVLSHYAVPGLPMGGTGQSGFGRRHGIEALDEMSRTRSLLVDRLGLRREPWWFPYSARSTRLVRSILEWRTRGGIGGFARALKWMFGR